MYIHVVRMFTITQCVRHEDYNVTQKIERCEFITIRVSMREKQKIADRAIEMGVTTSDYIRLRLCQEQPDLVQMANEKYHKALDKMTQDMRNPYA